MKKIFLLCFLMLSFQMYACGAYRTVVVPASGYYPGSYYNNGYYNTYRPYNNTPIMSFGVNNPMTTYPIVNYNRYNRYHPVNNLVSKSVNGTIKTITPVYSTRSYYPGGRTRTNYYRPGYSNTYSPIRYGY